MSKRIDTALTRLLGIEKPIMLAGMAGATCPELVGAVSRAGGIGVLGIQTSIHGGTERLAKVLMEVREQCAGAPFGVDLLIHGEGGAGRILPEIQRIIVESGVKVFVSGLGFPDKETTREFQRHGILVGSVCGSVKHARNAISAGIDFLVAQGTEGGGHTGRVGTTVLIPQVVDAVSGRIPIIAAGGIADGRGLAAALALGAAGVWVGTRFLASREAHVVDGYHRKILATGSGDTVITKSITGRTLRMARNEWSDYHEKHPEEIKPAGLQIIQSVKAGVIHLGLGPNFKVDTDKESYIMGQAVGLIDSILPAAQIVKEMNDGAFDILNGFRGNFALSGSKL
eukprot:955616_1